MRLLVKNPFFDKYHPEDMFYPGDIVEVENIERARSIIDSNLAVETVDAANRKMKNSAHESELKDSETKDETEHKPKGKRTGKK